MNDMVNSTTIEASEYAPGKWGLKVTIRADKVSVVIKNGTDIIESESAVNAQVVAVLAVLHNYDDSIVLPLKITEPLK